MTGGTRYGAEVRAAQAGDAPELARLLAIPGDDLAERLDTIRAGLGGTVLVVTGYGSLAGLVALNWAPWLQRARPVATITALAVDNDERRRGIGRLLLKAASRAARAAGCDSIVMVTDSGTTLAAFCQATGFAGEGTVWVRSLRKRSTE